MITYFKINQKALVEDIKKLDVFIKTKSFIPYADYILFKSDGENIYISAMDIENILIIKLRGVSEILKSFEICIENTFVKALSSLECDICFNFNDKMEICQLKFPLGEISIPAIPANDFPHIHNTGDLIFEIKENYLHEVITKILPFVDNDILTSSNSIHIDYKDNTLRIGARDNQSSCATIIPLKAKEDTNIMLSKKSFQILLSLLSPESNKPIQVKELKNDIIFSVFNGFMSCRRMVYGEMNKANDFYRLSMGVASREGDIIEIIDRKFLLEQIHIATVFNNEINKILIINLERDKLILEVEDNYSGRKSIQSVIVNFNHKGNTSKFIVDASHFTKFIRSIKKETFKINIPLENGEGKECIDKPMFCDDDGFIRLLGALTY